MRVEKIGVSQVDTISPDESVHTAAVRMRDHLIGCLVVCDGRQKPIGMLTDRDLATRVVAEGLDASRTAVSDVMTRLPRTVSQSASVDEVLATMQRVPCRRVPVVDDDGVMVALATLDDVLANLAQRVGQIGSLIRRESPASLDVL